MASQLWLRRQLWACVLGVVVASCARPRTRTPVEAARAFAEALSEGRPEDAYRLLSSRQREALSPGEFLNLVRNNHAELKELSKTLMSPVRSRVEGSLELPDGRTLRLVDEGDGFRFEQPVVNIYDRSTPAAARDTFVRAIEARRWDVLLQLMPQADALGVDPKTLAEHLTPQLEALSRLAALLASQRDAPIEIVGDRATMPYGEGSTMRFVRESDGWKVEEPE